jgi:hypothetical protein
MLRDVDWRGSGLAGITNMPCKRKDFEVRKNDENTGSLEYIDNCYAGGIKDVSGEESNCCIDKAVKA